MLSTSIGGALFAVTLATPSWACMQDTAPVIPGLHGRHPLEETAVGTLLIEELRCGRCHVGLPVVAPAVAPARAGPDLADVGARVSPEFLVRFLSGPAGAQPGTKMPDLLHAFPSGERDQVAQAITHFLVSRSSRAWAAGSVDERAVSTGAELFHTVGCVTCHAPRRPPDQFSETPAPDPGAVDLGHVPEKYGLASLAEFLFQPSVARPSGRMPDMGLTREEAAHVASYLLAADRPAAAALDVQPELVAAGKRYFQELDCGACHELDGIPPVTTTPIEDAGGGCLAPNSTGAPDATDALDALGMAQAPRFSLSSSQRTAILRALTAPVAEPSPEQRVAATLTRFNCIGCHARGDYGGVPPELDAYFTTDEHDLGDDARLPPPLTFAGAKLQGEWLRKVVFDGASVRGYMFTHMPRFGERNLAHLPGLLERADAGTVAPFEMTLPEGEEARLAREAGRDLMGVRGLGCIACHDFNGTPSPTHEGVDLINSPQRLDPSWFARFLVEPGTYRPGVVMPESWPGGVAAHTEILAGDTEAQLRAIWTYLSQGRTARDPDGIHPVASRLEVTDAPRTYRGRSSVAGYRGIAVGYPGGVNFAFNAQTGTLSALWSGDFVSVRWDGQGAGGFQPAARAVELAQDVSFVRLPDQDSPWPLRPRTTEEEPINPDPFYPRNHGYRFGGYQLDGASVPSFLYASGAVEIVDRCEAEITPERVVLRRTLTFTAPEPDELRFRVLTGEFEEVSAREFRTSRLTLRIPDVPFQRRSPGGADEADGADELLLELSLPRGVSTITIDYELLD